MTNSRRGYGLELRKLTNQTCCVYCGLDIYDCTGLDACRIIKEETVNLAELPLLLKNLQEGAGLLVDAET